MTMPTTLVPTFLTARQQLAALAPPRPDWYTTFHRDDLRRVPVPPQVYRCESDPDCRPERFECPKHGECVLTNWPEREMAMQANSMEAEMDWRFAWADAVLARGAR